MLGLSFLIENCNFFTMFISFGLVKNKDIDIL